MKSPTILQFLLISSILLAFVTATDPYLYTSSNNTYSSLMTKYGNDSNSFAVIWQTNTSSLFTYITLFPVNVTQSLSIPINFTLSDLKSLNNGGFVFVCYSTIYNGTRLLLNGYVFDSNGNNVKYYSMQIATSNLVTAGPVIVPTKSGFLVLTMSNGLTANAYDFKGNWLTSFYVFSDASLAPEFFGGVTSSQGNIFLYWTNLTNNGTLANGTSYQIWSSTYNPITTILNIPTDYLSMTLNDLGQVFVCWTRDVSTNSSLETYEVDAINPSGSLAYLFSFEYVASNNFIFEFLGNGHLVFVFDSDFQLTSSIYKTNGDPVRTGISLTNYSFPNNFLGLRVAVYDSTFIVNWLYYNPPKNASGYVERFNSTGYPIDLYGKNVLGYTLCNTNTLTCADKSFRLSFIGENEVAQEI